jgi:hypothetical protein
VSQLICAKGRGPALLADADTFLGPLPARQRRVRDR